MADDSERAAQIRSLLMTIPDQSVAGEMVRVADFLESVVNIPGSERLIVTLQAGHFEPQIMAPLRKLAEDKLRPLGEVRVVLTAERKAAASSAPAPASPRPGPHAIPPGRPIAPEVRHIIAVASGKGGVGKSTTAVNLALALLAKGYKVGILDADIHGPSLPRLLGMSGKPDSDGKLIAPYETYGLKAMSIGLMLDENKPVIWRGPMVQSALIQLLRDVNWGALDFLILDLPPGTGDIPLTLAQQTKLAGAVIVSTPQDLALLDARKGLAMFQRLDVPILGIVENMSFYSCPNCGHEAPIFGHGGAKAEAARLGVPFLGEVPLTLAVRESSDAGKPVVALDPQGSAAAPYHAIAGRMIAALGAVKKLAS